MNNIQIYLLMMRKLVRKVQVPLVEANFINICVNVMDIVDEHLFIDAPDDQRTNLCVRVLAEIYQLRNLKHMFRDTIISLYEFAEDDTLSRFKKKKKLLLFKCCCIT
jgi:hypothetical protein